MSNINICIKDIPSSNHGLNWANVHKRIIPQLIRKGVIYYRSQLVKKGLYFVLPEIVYRKFEDVIGKDMVAVDCPTRETLTVLTYALGQDVENGHQRELVPIRQLRFTLDEFSSRFISGPNLRAGEELDESIKRILGFQESFKK